MLQHFQAQYLPYSETGKFSTIILDYIEKTEQLTPFYTYTPDAESIASAIAHRQSHPTDRELLVKVLTSQYAQIHTSAQVKKNIELLASGNTFTICTAHQPNIFTGHLYFIYKILHTIKLAEQLTETYSQNNFVPVFYMGSEDADLEELGHIYIYGEKYDWETGQTGAVGKMQADESLIKLLDRISGQLATLPHGEELVQLLKRCYTKGISIQEATLQLVNELFGEYGLVVLLPDNADLKRCMLPVFEDDIFNNRPSEIVEKTIHDLSRDYRVQARPREINLFYLMDNIRSRLIKKNGNYFVEDTPIHFTEEEIRTELNNHPERFSPNVILRGLYQESILPNLAFVGGGGELAYWLELKDLFQYYKIPYPMLILRNSFMLIDKKTKAIYEKLQFTQNDLFKEENTLTNELVRRESTRQLYLTVEKQEVKELYEEIKNAAGQIDSTLTSHVEALSAKTLKRLDALEYKMLKAEKRKFEAQQRQIKKIKSALFPQGGLQERVDNFMPYYARFGKEFIAMLYKNSLVFQQRFCVLEEMEGGVG